MPGEIKVNGRADTDLIINYDLGVAEILLSVPYISCRSGT